MKKTMIFLGVLIALLALSACGGSVADTADSDAGQTVSEAAASEAQTDNAEAQTETIRLSADYADALSAESQLALGTVQLEDTELASTKRWRPNYYPCGRLSRV